jgi:hypothetical protein
MAKQDDKPMSRTSRTLMASGFGIVAVGALVWVFIGTWQAFVGAVVVLLALAAVDAATR